MQITRMHKEFAKIFKKKNLEECDNSFVQSKPLLLVDLFQNVRNMILNVNELDPTKFLSAPRFPWSVALKKTKAKLGLSTDDNVLLIFHKKL